MKTRIAFYGFLLVLSPYEEAMANNPPGPESSLAIVAILPMMMLLTLLGGGYEILRAYEEGLVASGKRPFLPGRAARIAGAILLIFFCLPVEGPIVLVAPLFGLIAVHRGIRFLKWGIQTLMGRTRPPHLANANAVRLITAGSILIPISLFLAGVPMAYYSYYMRMDFTNAEADKATMAVVAYQMAFPPKDCLGPSGRVHVFDAPHAETNRELRELRRAYEVKVDCNDGEDGFQIHLTPTARAFPLPPYNVFHNRPSYLADHLGNIRMIYVNGRIPCPPDAPVVMRVSKTDIERILPGRKQ